MVLKPRETVTKTWTFTSAVGATECGGGGVFSEHACNPYGSSFENLLLRARTTYKASLSINGTFDNGECVYCDCGCGAGASGVQLATSICFGNAVLCGNSEGGSVHTSWEYTPITDKWLNPSVSFNIPWSQGRCCPCEGTGSIQVSAEIDVYTVSGNTACIDAIGFYVLDEGKYTLVDETSGPEYSFNIFEHSSYCIMFDSKVYYFTCMGSDITYNYNVCGDPCEGVVCEDTCVGFDLWSQKCLDGICIEDVLLEADAAICENDNGETPVDFIINNKEYALLLIIAGLVAGVVLE